jgi:putative hydroxymethylpyrimidine transport system substrate-binding protein
MSAFTAMAGAAGLLAACGDDDGSESAASGGASSSKEPTKLNVLGEWLPWAAHAPVIVAINKGYFADNGLEVDFKGPPQPGDQMKFVAGGRSEISLTQTPDVIRARGTGIPVKIIGRLSNGQPTGIMAHPDTKLTDPKDLIGKTIGMAQTPDHIGGVNTMLETAGVDPADVKMVNKGYAGVQLVMTKKVDYLFAPLAGEYTVVRVETGKTPPFLKSTDYGVPNFPLLVWFAKEDYIAKNPKVITGFLGAISKGAKDVLAGGADLDSAIDEIAKLNDSFTREQHAAGAEDWMEYYTDDPVVGPEIIGETQKWMEGVEVDGKAWLPADQVEAPDTYLAETAT